MIYMVIGSREMRRFLLVAVLLGGMSACTEPTNTPVASSDLQGIKADVVFYGMESYLTSRGSGKVGSRPIRRTCTTTRP